MGMKMKTIVENRNGRMSSIFNIREEMLLKKIGLRRIYLAT